MCEPLVQYNEPDTLAQLTVTLGTYLAATGPSSSTRTAGAPLAPLPSRAAASAPPRPRRPALCYCLAFSPVDGRRVVLGRRSGVIRNFFVCRQMRKSLPSWSANARNLAAGANARNFRAVQIHYYLPMISTSPSPARRARPGRGARPPRAVHTILVRYETRLTR